MPDAFSNRAMDWLEVEVSPQKLSTVDFKVGTRVLISYTNESQTQYVSGPITLAAAANVEGKGDPVQKNFAIRAVPYIGDAPGAVEHVRGVDISGIGAEDKV